MTLVRTQLVVLASAVAVAAVAAGCGVPYSSEFDPVASDEIPFELANTTSTSTTTTLAPTTTVPASTSTTMPITTTTEVTVPIEIYYVSGSDLVVASRPLVGEATLERVMDVLQSGPPSGDEGEGLRAVIPKDADIEVEAEAGVAIVDLPEEIFDRDLLPRQDDRLVFGQIVLTLTARPGIGQVLFLLDGEETGVALPDSTSTDPGDLVSREDYIELLGTFTPPATSTTTSTTTTTTTTTTTLPPTTTETTAVP